MNSLFKDREDLLLEKLLVSKKISTYEAMDLLNVSKSTVRRIFIHLEKQGLVVRSYGGVQLAFVNAYSFDTLNQKYSEEKSNIGKAACNLLSDDDVIFIDAGTTSMKFAFHLSQAIAKGKLSIKSIFTNSLATLDVLAPVTTVSLIGGEYRSHRKDFYGYLAKLVIENLHFTKCFLGTDGIINQTYFAAMDFSTAALNSSLLKNSSQNIVLCDHSKFSSVSLVAWGSFSDINTIITDKGLNKEFVARIRSEGCNLTLV